MSLREVADVLFSARDDSSGDEGREDSAGDEDRKGSAGDEDREEDARGYGESVTVPDGVPMLAARGITVSLGGVEVLSDVDFTADRGQLVGLVGPNGAGKTTLIRTLRATLDPDAGEVEVAGRSVAGRSAREVSRLVASVPQTTALSFDFSVEDAVEMGRTPHVSRFGGLDATDRAAVAEAMDRTEVTQFADRAITEVSGGERQRVLLARALAQATPVLLLDEPTSNLDINHAIRTLELVRELVSEGKTAVAAIHDLNLAARYCDELVLLADGTVHAAGPPAEVLTAETLQETFDAETLVTRQAATGSPLVTPLPDREPIGRCVHVVGTGERAAATLAQLAGAGIDASIGVVPAGDTAGETARDLGFDAVTVPPFTPITADARDRAKRLAREADAVVVVSGDDSVVSGDDGVVPGTDGDVSTENRFGVAPGNQPVVDAGKRVIVIGREGSDVVGNSSREQLALGRAAASVERVPSPASVPDAIGTRRED